MTKPRNDVIEVTKTVVEGIKTPFSKFYPINHASKIYYGLLVPVLPKKI
jgi:hypothetical protein